MNGVFQHAIRVVPRWPLLPALVAGFLALLSLALPAPVTPAASAPVYAMKIDGAIGPATSDYLVRGLAHAQASKAQLVVVQMDTPGGLDVSMREIIKAILGSKVPVAVFVAPSGARAASAGTYILYASHIAAMAPGTNLGAATPVQVGGVPEPIKPEDAKPGTGKPEDGKARETPDASTMTKKQVNDAAAYLRSLAQMRGRNVEWAEKAVRESVSLPAEDALKMRVVDYVAPDRARLLQQLDGAPVAIQERAVRLSTAAAPVIEYAPDWRIKLLAAITAPSIALILVMLGVYGLFFEFMSPGTAVPGVLGAILLLLGLYGLHLLPVNYAGLALILLGVALMAAEAFVGGFGVMGIGGVSAFVIGAVILIDTEMPGFGIPLGLIVAVAVISAFTFGLIGHFAWQARKRQPVSGDHALVGSLGLMKDDAAGEGWAMVGGESWRVRTTAPVLRGQRVRVVAREGLTLLVEPVERERKESNNV